MEFWHDYKELLDEDEGDEIDRGNYIEVKSKWVRKELEKDHVKDVAYPERVVQRAVCYASLIYQYATNGKDIDLDWVEGAIASKNGFGFRGEARQVLACGRSFGALVDNTPGLVIIEVKGASFLQEWRQIYVVFRGSRGDQGEELTDKTLSKQKVKANPNRAGWAMDHSYFSDPNNKYKGLGSDTRNNPGWKNIDWRADMDSIQVVCRHGGGARNIKVHRGFQTMYDSMHASVTNTLDGMDVNNKNTVVVVTGHSLGAGLSTLCAYHLSYFYPNAKIVYSAFCPPRAGNKSFVVDFNRRLAYRTSQYDEGAYRRAFNFLQSDDIISKGGKYAAKKAFKYDDTAPESSTVGRILAIGKKSVPRISADVNAKYYHVQNIMTVGKGFHAYTAMMDSIFKSKISRTEGLFIHMA